MLISITIIYILIGALLTNLALKIFLNEQQELRKPEPNINPLNILMTMVLWPFFLLVGFIDAYRVKDE